MSGGGGGGGVDNSAAEARAREDEERKAAQAREDAKRETDRQEGINRTNAANRLHSRNAARDAARGRLVRELEQRGESTTEYQPLVEQILGERYNAVPESVENAFPYFDGDELVNEVIGGKTTQRRREFTGQVNTALPSNIGQTRFSDTADDSFINEILGKQRTEAQLSIDRAKSRGNLDERGYQAAIGRIGELESAGRATAQTLAGSVIENYRTKADDIRQRATSAASSYELGGQAFDVNPYLGELSNLEQSYNTNLGGEVSNALAGQSFFDVGDILTRGGNIQGAVNPQTPASVAALSASRRGVNPNLTQRGEKDTGVF